MLKSPLTLRKREMLILVKINFIYITLLLTLLPISSGRAQIIGIIDKNGAQKIDPENLNDADSYVRDNFINSGFQQRALDEACKDKKESCQGFSQGSPFAPYLGKAYAAIVGSLDDKFKIKTDKKKVSALKPGETKKPSPPIGSADENKKIRENGNKKKTKKDYCKLIAIGTEIVASFQQASAQLNLSNLPSNKETAQADQLNKAAISHDERSNNSKTQTIGWGATSLCYTYYATMGGIELDWNIGLKLVGSYALLGFYALEMGKHKKAANQMRTIAAKLPRKGECNPITDRACYCAQIETRNDVTYCTPQIRKRQIAKSSTQVTCLNNKLKADPKCNCLATNTCFDSEFSTQVNSLGFGSGFNKSVVRPFSKLVRGELVAANASGGASQLSALAKQGIRRVGNKFPAFRGTLTKKQKRSAGILVKQGVPASLAANFISRNVAGSKKYSKRFKGGSFGNVASYSPRKTSKNSVLNFNRGGLGLQGQKKRKNRSSFNVNKFIKKKKSNKRGSIIKFQERALRSADISKNSSKNVFDIISRRYMISGWSRLELQ